MIDIETAQRITSEIDEVATALNRKLGEAAGMDFLLEIDVIELRQMSDDGSTPFIKVTAKIDPRRIDLKSAQEEGVTLRAIVQRRWWQQDQRCIWCGEWCWIPGFQTRDALRQRFGIVKFEHGSKKAINRRRATADHIIPKSFGGTNRQENIVYACRGCNNRRGALIARFDPVPEIVAMLPPEVRKRLRRAIMDRLEAAE